MAAVSGTAAMPSALRPASAFRRAPMQGRTSSVGGPQTRALAAAAELDSQRGRRRTAFTAVPYVPHGRIACQKLLPAGRRLSQGASSTASAMTSPSTALRLLTKWCAAQSGTDTSDAPTDTDTETSPTEASADPSPPALSPTSDPPPLETEPPADETPSSPDTDTTLSSAESAPELTDEQSPVPESPPLPHILGGDYTVLGFITAGPLLARAGITFSEVEDNLSQWVELGGVLAKQLGFDVAGGLSDSEQRRIFHYYLPVFFWCMRQLAAHREQQGSGTSRPLVVGISAPQGCGKTTVVESLEYLFAYSGLSTAGISLDDFYLTYEEQTQLAASNPGNKLLELRGNAGSHDLQLAQGTLEALLKATTPDVSVPLPRYEKSAYSGRGDRAPAESWPVAKGPVAVVLLEGWMLGFEPLLDAEAAAVDPDLVAVNQRLGAYRALHDAVDAWVVIQVNDVQCVFQWRLEAEVRMRSKGKPGMTDEQVADFVSRYMPAYKAYLSKLYSEAPGSATPDNTLRITVDRQRNPLV